MSDRWPKKRRMQVELIVHGSTAGEIVRKAEEALDSFFTDTDYEWSIDCRAITLNDGTIMGFQADVTGKAEP